MTRSMRIACLHIPQYALQCATRVDPSLRGPAAGAGAAIAMVDAQGPSPRIAAGSGPLHAPVVVACSRAAWALGVRLGMTATAARSISSEISVVAVAAAAEREAGRAIADALLARTPVVDLGGRVGAGGAHLAMYAEVPQKMRGHTFGERALERLAELGLTGRIGIADDRFTAWVAAASGARPLEADYRALARGESGTHLRPYAPEAAIREELVVSAGNVLDAEGTVSGPTAISIVAKRIALRLEGRGRGAARVELVATTGEGARTIVPDLAAVAELGVAAAAAQADLPGHISQRATPAITSAELLSRAFAQVLEVTGEATTWRLRATVIGEAVTVMDEHAVAVTNEYAMPVRTIDALDVAH